MQIRIDQLNSHLQQSLQPVYMVSGDEPLQRMEAMDAIRKQAREQGYSLREVLTVNKEFSWSELSSVANSFSLFADRRIIELRVESGLGKEGSQALVEYVERPADDAILLIQMAKIDSRSQSAKWFKALDSIGTLIQVWPVKPNALPQWIQRRCRSRDLEIERDAVALLAARVEGNLLAAAQEIEKLVLLYGQEKKLLTQRDVLEAVADSARYSVYDLVDVACSGSLPRACAVLSGLRQEGVAAALVLWALTNEIRNCYGYASRIAAGEPEQRVLSAVWQSRKNIVSQALRRLDLPTWGILLRLCATTDRTVKGTRFGREWDLLEQIVMGLAAGKLMRAAI